jgi:site-specific DNA-methyltransferase (cytosine-N4-specific)
MKIPAHLDRYPAKMVSKLARRLVERYAFDARNILDPFCGSGAILVAGQRGGIPVSGVDINPVAELLASVKLKGFDPSSARRIVSAWTQKAKAAKQACPISWEAKHYWFSPTTLDKFERLRTAFGLLGVCGGREKRAALLSYALAVRLCSKADQRSPKPFISRRARASRGGRHFDPYRIMSRVLAELSVLYGGPTVRSRARIIRGDFLRSRSMVARLGEHSHIITSPPYINAQDYFRNFKLELYLLEGMIPFSARRLAECFIGTERGDLVRGVPKEAIRRNLRCISRLEELQDRSARLAAVVHRYFHDMDCALDVIQRCLNPGGCLVVVCADNLVGGIRIPTWQVLQQMIEERGFRLFDTFTDPILDRVLPPRRCGHRGLIKEETVLAFRH